MVGACTLCLIHPPDVGLLCARCIHRFNLPHPALQEMSLYKYEAGLRELVLRAKIRGDHRALRSLQALFADHPLTQSLANWAQFIVPAPSSLWSRIRGRFDVAWLIAKELSVQSQVPIASAPRLLYWNIRKRALLGNRALSPDVYAHPLTPDPSAPRFLIVDDVVTSGYTLMRVKQHMTGHIRFLTLASAQ